MADLHRAQQLRLLLPFYLNNTLSQAQREEIEAWLAQDGAARQELQFMRLLRQAAGQHSAARAPLQGYDRLAARLAERRPPAAPWWQRLLSLQWAPLATLTLLLVSVQIGWNVWRVKEESATLLYRGVTQAGHAADLKLVLRADARVGDLVELLAENHSHIVWGPSSAGELWIALDQLAELPATRSRLLQSSLVVDVLPVEKR
ncbi:hypothetical protein [Duganella fentianensis]|uniref:anti-sigma factor family protein n=1 Tax=Duganella fentianensis TaxID=2692177 RepID=UPI0032B2F35D